MRDDAIYESIPEQWRPELQRFLAGKKVTDRFLEFLDTNEACQQAIERAFDVSAETLLGELVAATGEAVPAEKGVRAASGTIFVAPASLDVIKHDLTESLAARLDLDDKGKSIVEKTIKDGFDPLDSQLH